jgi:hypothetical protein
LNTRLIEFDVRIARDQYVGRRWDKDSKAEYLLRPDVEWPLSVDRSVWPSVFFSKTFRDHRDSYSTIPVDPKLEGNEWLDLARMRTHYDAHRRLAPGGVFVGIELLSEKTLEGSVVLYEGPSGSQCGISLAPTVPDRVPEGSTHIGYDVATAGWISGLANCGYTEDEIAELGPLWAPRLNSVGLLSTLEDAVAFRQISDQRVPEEAPFWIYALWKLPVA